LCEAVETRSRVIAPMFIVTPPVQCECSSLSCFYFSWLLQRSIQPVRTRYSARPQIGSFANSYVFRQSWNDTAGLMQPLGSVEKLDRYPSSSLSPLVVHISSSSKQGPSKIVSWSPSTTSETALRGSSPLPTVGPMKSFGPRGPPADKIALRCMVG
jgi:hypothetical protein